MTLNSTCKADGTWTSSASVCPTGPPECPVDHPDANLTNVKVTSTSIGTTLSYTCHWNKSMTLNSTCKADGTWTSSASVCPTGPPECPVDHPDANLTNVKVTSTSIGTTLSYTCHWNKSMTLNSTCKADGTWTSSASVCPTGPPECPVDHPDANLTNVKVTSTSIGTTLPYTCHWNTSMTLNSTCKADGTWTSSASICPTGPTDCFDTHDSCWYQFNFAYDTAFNGCPDGDRFVRRTKYSSAPFVGVVLCSPTRYKILLGASLTGTFLNVGDGVGQGEDLCELVGGLEINAYLPWDNTNAPEMTGYARRNWGEEFQLQPIAGGTGWKCKPWYECGVQIPGTPEPDCMSATPPCWYSYNVWLDNNLNGCSHGQIFVKRTNYTSAPFLAVQLCNSTRYKLFLGSSLGGIFMNIADMSGNGEDHCELVGGSQLSASILVTSSTLPEKGYYRHHVGEQFGIESFFEFPYSYECGVSIPGTDIVV
uniref:Uncharacterized protein LOC111104979 n=1 Tax=Crassostrea virginica TaxID=6565 RepID=A0A8B8AX47_CRAVI|nr:uncharacterized protein LOC111104979 [Crassostrea virginica]